MGDNNSVSLAIYFHTRRVQSVNIGPQDVTVRLGSEQLDVAITGKLCEQFANLSTDKQVRDFALSRWLYSSSAEHVTVSREGIRFERDKIRWHWRTGAALSKENADLVTVWPAVEGEWFEVTRHGLTYYASSLVRVMEVFLAGQPAEYFKLCPNPDCPSPYVFSTDGRDKLCGSNECRRWKHQQAQKEYRQRKAKAARRIRRPRSKTA